MINGVDREADREQAEDDLRTIRKWTRPSSVSSDVVTGGSGVSIMSVLAVLRRRFALVPPRLATRRRSGLQSKRQNHESAKVRKHETGRRVETQTATHPICLHFALSFFRAFVISALPDAQRQEPAEKGAPLILSPLTSIVASASVVYATLPHRKFLLPPACSRLPDRACFSPRRCDDPPRLVLVPAPFVGSVAPPPTGYRSSSPHHGPVQQARLQRRHLSWRL